MVRELVRHIDLIPKVIPLTLTLDMVLSFSLDNITTFIVSMFSWRMKMGVSGLGCAREQTPCHRLTISWPTWIIYVTRSLLTGIFLF